MFVDTEIEKHKFHHNRVQFVQKTQTMITDQCLTKCFLAKNLYAKSYDGQTKWIYFLIKYDPILKKSSNIWDKIRADIKKELDREPAYKELFWKTKTKSSSDEASNSHAKKYCDCTSLAVITVYSALMKD